MRIILKIFLCISILLVSSCSGFAIFYDAPDDYRDEKVISLLEPINTVQDGYTFANNRVNEWAEFAKLHMIKVCFTGDQISGHRGLMEYQFNADNGKDNYLAKVTVTIDMETNNSTLLNACFDPRTRGKRVKEGVKDGWHEIHALDMTEWTLTIDEAFDIIYNNVGKNAFMRFVNPKITLICSSDNWTFFVTKENEDWYGVIVKNQISINPVTGEITKIKGFSKDSTL